MLKKKQRAKTMVKKICRNFLINSVALMLVSSFLAGFKISQGLTGIAFTAAVLTGINFALKPLIRLLLLPINLLTLGAFRWLANVFSLYLVTLLVPYLQIEGFQFPGLNYQGFIIPSMYLGFVVVLLISSFLISLINTFLFWLFD